MVKPRLDLGSVIDGFTVRALIHKGGMAHLYDVAHPDQSMPLIMKVPIINQSADPAAIVGFEMEQMIMPRLSGRHVPRFVAAGDFAVQPYLVYERINGTTLYPMLESLPRRAAEVAELAAKIATALQSLHAQHVIHLDIKPSNILLRGEDQSVVLIDYGLSHHNQLPDLMAEEFRLPYGTAPYMAPEQVFGIRTDLRSDIFALGVLMYFFTTGVRPFGDPQTLKGLKRRVWDDPVPPRKRNPDIPAWLQDITLRCLSVDPAARHATAAQLAFDLSHPDQVQVTPRANKLTRDPWSTRIHRRFNPAAYRPVAARSRSVAASLAAAPIVAVAIDLSESHRELSSSLKSAVKRILASIPGARLACLNVQLSNLLGNDAKLDADGNSIHIQRLVELRAWARDIGIAQERVTCHVLEATDAGDAIVDYVRTNTVEHVVLGASTADRLRNLLGSVATEVVQKAPCSVTVVRPPRTALHGPTDG
jgi:eukaryotic-like serine/threonine-protein kinase